MQVREGYERLRKTRLDEFMAGFNVISLKLKEMYQMITLGGDAELELVDSLDPFSEVTPQASVLTQTLGIGDLKGFAAELRAIERNSPQARLRQPAMVSAGNRSGSFHESLTALHCACTGHCVQCTPTQEELEEYCQPEWWREDSELAQPGVCAAPLQADTPVRDGRD